MCMVALCPASSGPLSLFNYKITSRFLKTKTAKKADFLTSLWAQITCLLLCLNIVISLGGASFPFLSKLMHKLVSVDVFLQLYLNFQIRKYIVGEHNH